MRFWQHFCGLPNFNADNESTKEQYNQSISFNKCLQCTKMVPNLEQKYNSCHPTAAVSFEDPLVFLARKLANFDQGNCCVLHCWTSQHRIYSLLPRTCQKQNLARLSRVNSECHCQTQVHRQVFMAREWNWAVLRHSVPHSRDVKFHALEATLQTVNKNAACHFLPTLRVL